MTLVHRSPKDVSIFRNVLGNTSFDVQGCGDAFVAKVKKELCVLNNGNEVATLFKRFETEDTNFAKVTTDGAKEGYQVQVDAFDFLEDLCEPGGGKGGTCEGGPS